MASAQQLASLREDLRKDLMEDLARLQSHVDCQTTRLDQQMCRLDGICSDMNTLLQFRREITASRITGSQQAESQQDNQDASQQDNQDASQQDNSQLIVVVDRTTTQEPLEGYLIPLLNPSLILTSTLTSILSSILSAIFTSICPSFLHSILPSFCFT